MSLPKIDETYFTNFLVDLLNIASLARRVGVDVGNLVELIQENYEELANA